MATCKQTVTTVKMKFITRCPNWWVLCINSSVLGENAVKTQFYTFILETPVSEAYQHLEWRIFGGGLIAQDRHRLTALARDVGDLLAVMFAHKFTPSGRAAQKKTPSRFMFKKSHRVMVHNWLYLNSTSSLSTLVSKTVRVKTNPLWCAYVCIDIYRYVYAHLLAQVLFLVSCFLLNLLLLPLTLNSHLFLPGHSVSCGGVHAHKPSEGCEWNNARSAPGGKCRGSEKAPDSNRTERSDEEPCRCFAEVFGDTSLCVITSFYPHFCLRPILSEKQPRNTI